MAIVVIGNFDGVHLGHKLVMERAVEEASKRSQTVTVLTFDVHPKTFFCPNQPVKRIVTDKKKKELLRSLGADEVVFQRFDRVLAETEPETYLRFLKTEYACEVLVCGKNFRLGRNASADVGTLKQLAKPLGITVESVGMSYLSDGTPISSTNVRRAIEAGQPERACEMLGRLFSLEGEVRHGREVGRTMNLPTANLSFDDDLLLPKSGVYATFVLTDGAMWRAVTNVGTNPTVTSEGKTVVETHLLECISGTPRLDLYGRTLTVVFLSYLREERRFGNLDELKRQIDTDIQKSSAMFREYADKSGNF